VPKRCSRSRGRPTKLTPALQESICKQLEFGVPEHYAAEANGIARSTFCEWMEKGASGIEPYTEFYKAVRRSIARAIRNLTRHALNGGKGSSRATWLLERRFPNEYGRQAKSPYLDVPRRA
jgi:hypothetical protein